MSFYRFLPLSLISLVVVGCKPSIDTNLSTLDNSKGSDRILALSNLLTEAGQADLESLLRQELKGVRKSAALLALAKLGALESAELDTLLSLIGDPAPEIRIATIFAMGSLGTQAAPAVSRLVDAFRIESDPWVKRTLLFAMGSIHSEPEITIPLLVNSLAMGEGAEAAVLSLEAFGVVAIPAILDSLRDSVPTVSHVEALSRIGRHDVENVIDRISELEGVGRVAGMVALERLGEPAVPSLVKALGKGKDSRLKADIASVLGRMRFRALSATSELERLLGEGADEPRRSAARALGLIGCRDSSILLKLEKALEHEDSMTRELAAYALGDLNAESSVDRLGRCLNDEVSSVRLGAAVALGNIGPPSSVQTTRLAQLALNDSERAVQRASADALRKIRDREPGALEPMLRILESHKDPLIRGIVARAIELGPKLPTNLRDRLHLIMTMDTDRVVRERVAIAYRKLD